MLLLWSRFHHSQPRLLGIFSIISVVPFHSFISPPIIQWPPVLLMIIVLTFQKEESRSIMPFTFLSEHCNHWSLVFPCGHVPFHNLVLRFHFSLCFFTPFNLRFALIHCLIWSVLEMSPVGPKRQHIFPQMARLPPDIVHSPIHYLTTNCISIYYKR